MFILVTGGSGSGKSAYAEEEVMKLSTSRRFYIATMQCGDDESKKRVERHRKMRAGKEFVTIECPLDLEKVAVSKDSVVLLECMSNLTANEMFRDKRRQDPVQVAEKIMTALEKLKKSADHLVVVTNEVFSDGVLWGGEMADYLKCLGEVNRRMADMADCVTEVVYSIPVEHKREREDVQ